MDAPRSSLSLQILWAWKFISSESVNALSRLIWLVFAWSVFSYLLICSLWVLFCFRFIPINSIFLGFGYFSYLLYYLTNSIYLYLLRLIKCLYLFLLSTNFVFLIYHAFFFFLLLSCLLLDPLSILRISFCLSWFGT